MLRVGLTGGIGSGKSTVARILAGFGAHVVDADAVAREVVEAGMPSLTAIRERFGDAVFTSTGELDRPALGRVVFSDPDALRDLESITHPAIWSRTAELMAAAPADAILVHDMPLIVEKDLVADYHLVIVVGVDETERLARLVRDRGMDPTDARARIGAQADDDARRAAADAWLDNNGSPDALAAAVGELWHERLVPFDANLRDGIRAHRHDDLVLVPWDDRWPLTARRLCARIEQALGPRAVDVEHIGSTAIPEMVAKPVIDLQVGVASLQDADDPGFIEAMARAGFPRVGGIQHDNAKDGTSWPKRFHAGADPGQLVNVHVRAADGPGHDWALRFRDWLRADPDARRDYIDLKRS